MQKKLLIITGGVLLVLSLLSWNPISNSAGRYARDIGLAAVGVYASLRTVNAILSTVQEIEVGGSFVVSGTAQPLKMLEPLDDTVERVAGVVLAVSIGAGVVSLSIGPLAGIGAALLLAGASLSYLTDTRQLPVWGKPQIEALERYGLGLCLLLPAAFLASALMADMMTRGVWEEHEELLNEVSLQMQLEAPLTDTDEAGGFTGAVSRLFSGTPEPDAAQEKDARSTFEMIDDYRNAAMVILEKADDLVVSYIAILSVFLFKSLVLPLAVFYGLTRLIPRAT